MTLPTGPPPGPGPRLGLVLLLEHPSGAAARPASIQLRVVRMHPPQSGAARMATLAPSGRPAHLICYNRSRQDTCGNRCHGRLARVSPRTGFTPASSRSTMRRLRQAIKQRKPFQSLQQEVFLEVLRTGHALVQDLVELLKPYGLTQPQYNVLRILRGAGAVGLPTGEVGERMVASREPDVTRLLVRMEQHGLVARERRADNRRFVTVRITREGRRVLKALDQPVLDMHATQLHHMARGELELLAGLLERARREGSDSPLPA